MIESKFAPGPRPANNIFSQISMFLTMQRDIMGMFKQLKAKYGDIYTFKIGETYNYIISDPDAMHEVLVTNAKKFYKDRDMKDTRNGLARFLGNGLLTSDGEFWKRQRRLAAPALHARRIESYAETMVNYTETMLNSWHSGAKLDISKEMSALTMRIVAKTLFDADVSDQIERVGKAMEAVQSLAGPPPVIPPWVPTPHEFRLRRAGQTLDDIIYGIIREWHKTGEDKGDLLSMLLLAETEDGERMTDQQARDETVTLFLAGHETTANSLNWTFMLLAQHPEVEAKLHAELDAVLAGRSPTLADLERLPYTEMVVKESMRLYPPAWIIGRQAIEDTEIAGWSVPKGSLVNLVIYLAHHEARWWPEPERFMPERFALENDANINKRAYIPFSSGPRVCIGNSFAMMEARLLLAAIASRYTLSLEPGQQVDMNPMITLNPKNGLPMTVRIRQPVLELA
ncbi:MAG: cytochrome P450 [Anaerolineae bacterium]|nr:cytochrome P450 [Anaerolineae bacterium]